MMLVVVPILLALAGCTFVAPRPTPAETVDEPYSIDQGAVAETLGEVPPGEAMTPERSADFIARSLDRSWSGVAAQYPDAVRPDVALESMDDGTGSAFMACIAPTSGAAGREIAMATYVCSARFPSVPNGMLTHDQAGYLYDYWTGFVMPCYTANNVAIESSPPDRDDVIARWPFQDWWPTPVLAGGTEGIEQSAQIEKLCPPSPDGLG